LATVVVQCAVGDDTREKFEVIVAVSGFLPSFVALAGVFETVVELACSFPTLNSFYIFHLQ